MLADDTLLDGFCVGGGPTVELFDAEDSWLLPDPLEFFDVFEPPLELLDGFWLIVCAELLDGFWLIVCAELLDGPTLEGRTELEGEAPLEGPAELVGLAEG